ncbi:hypothetical protein V2H45_05895 [Tumidithrix elongata RA019]|uniref:Uncharacterized protein n=1 Tax=Tumidithrix elongata BACA0141 TaxID=2716417 RepID=A0AAW9PZA1_9CYAN|nr:hypothetical protein [Tumidithrix elongata RA019]
MNKRLLGALLIPTGLTLWFFFVLTRIPFLPLLGIAVTVRGIFWLIFPNYGSKPKPSNNQRARK